MSSSSCSADISTSNRPLRQSSMRCPGSDDTEKSALTMTFVSITTRTR